MSHVVLDLFTKSGVKFLIPFYKQPTKKQWAGLFICVWAVIALSVIKFYGFTLFGMWTIL
jgi:hypothetical protein